MRWRSGQSAKWSSAEAALDLLRLRVQNKEAPWPEFAEYDCTGCHHDLTEPSWRQRQHGVGRHGALTWGSWYFSLLGLLDDDGVTIMRPRRFGALGSLMERPMPSKKEVEQQLKLASRETGLLRQRFAMRQGDPGLARKTLGHLRQQPFDRFQNWDAAEQAFLAFQALDPVAGLMPPREDTLMEMRAWPPSAHFNPEKFFQRLTSPQR